MTKEYTYYHFWDDLCQEDDPDNYRMGPEGLQFQIEYQGERLWVASGFENMEDLLTDCTKFGPSRYEEIDVD